MNPAIRLALRLEVFVEDESSICDNSLITVMWTVKSEKREVILLKSKVSCERFVFKGLQSLPLE